MRHLAKLMRNRLIAVVAALVVSSASPAAIAENFNAVLERWAQTLESRATETESDSSVREPAVRIGQGTGFKPGHSGERVSRLAQRLVELGLLDPADVSAEYSGKIVDAVIKYQESTGLKADGVVGSGTVAALDASPKAGIAAMRESAGRLRELAGENIRDGLFVNLPSQTVTLVRGGQYVFTMRAIVGRPSRETPLLNDKITHIIVNPTWTVPPTVMKEDKLPNLKKTGKPGISNALVYLDGEEIDPAIVDWSDVTPGRVRIVQTPGNHNALGRFRFNLTNSQSIYLHGTNEPHLFDRDLRTISSGCVRLHDARRLAEILLADDGVGKETVDRLLATMTPQWIKLRHPLPVRFTYWLATVGEDGKARAHPDVYDRSDVPASAAQAQKTAGGGRQG